jgi:hypothetical protein
MVIRRTLIALLLLTSFSFGQAIGISPFNFYNISDSSSSGGGTGGSSPGGGSFTAPDDVFAEADRLLSVEAGELIDSSAGTVTAWYSRYDLTDGFTITPTSDPPIAYITDVDNNKLAYPNFSGSHALVTNSSNTFYDSLLTRSAFTILYVCQPTNNSANSVFIQWYKNYDYLFRLEVESDGDLIVEVRDPSSGLINAPIASYPPTTMADSIMVFGLSWNFSTKTFTTYAQGNKTATVMSMFTGAKVNWYDVNETLEMSKDNLSNQTNKTYAFYIYDGVQSDADINTALAYLANKYKAAAWVETPIAEGGLFDSEGNQLFDSEGKTLYAKGE